MVLPQVASAKLLSSLINLFHAISLLDENPFITRLIGQALISYKTSADRTRNEPPHYAGSNVECRRILDTAEATVIVTKTY